MNKELQIRDIARMKTICTDCHEDFTCHSFNLVCHTLEGGAIFYTNIANASKYNDTDGIVKHCTNYLQFINPTKWTWIIDFEGFGLKHTMGIKTGIQLSKLVNTFGCLHQFIAINSNIFVEQMLNIIKLVLNKEFHDSMQILHSKYEFMQKFIEWMPTDVESLNSLHLLV